MGSPTIRRIVEPPEQPPYTATVRVGAGEHTCVTWAPAVMAAFLRAMADLADVSANMMTIIPGQDPIFEREKWAPPSGFQLDCPSCRTGGGINPCNCLARCGAPRCMAETP